ncbi:MAG: hypothetical protein KF705_01775 [Phycisphaeraceae bacterium]|nr:hypothetical protein [Phycisphaeraceae bacterium]
MRRKCGRSRDLRRARIIAATLVCLLCVLTVCVNVDWTSPNQRVTVVVYAGRVGVCVRNTSMISSPAFEYGPGPGLRFGLGPFRPKFLSPVIHPGFRSPSIHYPGQLGDGVQLAAYVFAASAGYLIYSLAFTRRRDPHTTCDHCGYCLTGLPADRCPECGTPLQLRTGSTSYP